MRKDQRIKAKIIGQPHGRLTAWLSGRVVTSAKSNDKCPSVKVKRLVAPWASAAPHFGHASPPSPVKGWRFCTQWAMLWALAVIAASEPQSPKRQGHIHHLQLLLAFYASIKTGVPFMTSELSSISFSIRCWSVNELKSISRGVILNVI